MITKDVNMLGQMVGLEEMLKRNPAWLKNQIIGLYIGKLQNQNKELTKNDMYALIDTCKREYGFVPRDEWKKNK